MKTKIEFKEDKFFWEQKKIPNKYNGKSYWILDQDGPLAIIYQDVEGMWRLDSNQGLGNLFDGELKFQKEVSAQHYVQSKLLKWIKNIISIRI